MVQKKKLNENLENLDDDIINERETTKTETKNVKSSSAKKKKPNHKPDDAVKVNIQTTMP